MRNTDVEQAVGRILELLDGFIGGNSLTRPVPKNIQAVFDENCAEKGGSVKLAMTFFSAYAVINRKWDFKKVPVGIRGAYGDKRLGAQLSKRFVTFHNNITAFGENLGWKGNVRNASLTRDPRFATFIKAISGLTSAERQILLEHVAWRLYESRIVPKIMPSLPPKYLSYSRALYLCEKLLATQTEGHIQQFLVAAFLFVHRSRFGFTIKTHHPHASDKSDGTTGDVEEFADERLIAAYEITVRDDWKNRLPDFEKKATRGLLAKYVIIASNVRSDPTLCPAENLVHFTCELTFDLAVVDIRDFFTVFCAELSKNELASAFNKAFEYISSPELCGRPDVINVYETILTDWLEA